MMQRLNSEVSDMNLINNEYVRSVIENELVEKKRARKGYDSILWKIRISYLLCVYCFTAYLYAMYSCFSIPKHFPNPVLLLALLLSFLATGLFFDIHFLRCKLRLIKAIDEINDILLKSNGDVFSTVETDRITQLIHNSGESNDHFPLHDLASSRLLILYPINTIVPVLIIVMYWVQRI